MLQWLLIDFLRHTCSKRVGNFYMHLHDNYSQILLVQFYIEIFYLLIYLKYILYSVGLIGFWLLIIKIQNILYTYIHVMTSSLTIIDILSITFSFLQRELGLKHIANKLLGFLLRIHCIKQNGQFLLLGCGKIVCI